MGLGRFCAKILRNRLRFADNQVMTDCVISYTTPDVQLARSVQNQLTREGLSVFMADVSLVPGLDWTQQIKKALSETHWVIFLASRKACTAPYVQQEIGAAIFNGKRLVPVVWDIAPEELPGWAKQYQAIDLRGKSIFEIPAQVNRIAMHIHAHKAKIKAENTKGLMIISAVVAGLWLLDGQK